MSEIAFTLSNRDNDIGRVVDLMPSWLWRAYARVNAAVAEALSEFDITAQQWTALATLHQHGAMSQRQLAHHTGVDPVATHGMVLRLMARGYASRAPDAFDKRRIVVDLTARGEELVEEATPAVARAKLRVIAPLGRWEASALLKLLERVASTK